MQKFMVSINEKKGAGLGYGSNEVVDAVDAEAAKAIFLARGFDEKYYKIKVEPYVWMEGDE